MVFLIILCMYIYIYIYIYIYRITGIIKKVRPMANKYTLLSIYNALFVPHLYYCAHIWGNNVSSLTDYINKLQKRILKLILKLISIKIA